METSLQLDLLNSVVAIQKILRDANPRDADIDRFDNNKDGRLTTMDLLRMVRVIHTYVRDPRANGITCSRAELVAFSRLDGKSKNLEVSVYSTYAAFYAAVYVDYANRYYKEDVSHLFQMLDMDGNGKVDRADANAILSAYRAR